MATVEILGHQRERERRERGKEAVKFHSRARDEGFLDLEERINGRERERRRVDVRRSLKSSMSLVGLKRGPTVAMVEEAGISGEGLADLPEDIEGEGGTYKMKRWRGGQRSVAMRLAERLMGANNEEGSGCSNGGGVRQCWDRGRVEGGLEMRWRGRGAKDGVDLDNEVRAVGAKAAAQINDS